MNVHINTLTSHFHCYPHHQHLHPFPTRRSSDLYELPYDGPYPIFCTALNLVRGKDLAWQQRKAESFIYTPRFCGYDRRSEEHTSELQSRFDLVCRLLLEKKKQVIIQVYQLLLWT